MAGTAGRLRLVVVNADGSEGDELGAAERDGDQITFSGSDVVKDTFATLSRLAGGDTKAWDLIARDGWSSGYLALRADSGTVKAAAAAEGDAGQGEEKVGHREPTEQEQQTGVDFATIAADHEQAVTDLLEKWPVLAAALVLALATAGAAAVAGGALVGLASLAVDDTIVADLATAIAVAMDALSSKAAKLAAAEVTHQGGSVKAPKRPGALSNSDVAQIVARLLTDGYSSAAVRVALQHAGEDEAAVRQAIEDALNAMSEADKGWVADNLAAAMSAAQGAGRHAVFELLPDGTKYLASEHNDRNQCKPCKDIDQTVFDSLADADEHYPLGIYRACLGRSRCRGQVIPILT